jgi:hypothetical protein
MSGVERASAVSGNDSSSPKTVVAACPSGKTAIGGGGLVSDTAVVLTATYPTTGAESWTATGAETGLGLLTDWTVTAWVICATVAT